VSKLHGGAHPTEPGHEASLTADAADCAMVQDLAEPFALNALEPDQHLAFEAHCQHCRQCQRLIDGIKQSVTMLAFSVPQVSPPLPAKAALFARIEQASSQPPTETNMASASLASLRTPTLPASDPGAPVNPPAKAPAQDPVPRRRRARLAAYSLPLATLPLLLALGFVGYWGLDKQQELNAQTNRLQEMTMQVERLNSQVGQLGQGFSNLDQYLGVGGAKQYTMRPQSEDQQSDAAGRIIAKAGNDKAMLMVWRLDGKMATYDIIVELPNGTRYDAGDLEVNGNGGAMLTVDLGRPISDVKSIHIQPQFSNVVSDTLALGSGPDALYALIGPELGDNLDTAVQNP
jgi:hypothetical protein